MLTSFDSIGMLARLIGFDGTSGNSKLELMAFVRDDLAVRRIGVAAPKTP